MHGPSLKNPSSTSKASHEWLRERLTALLLIPLTIWFAFFLVRLPSTRLPELLAWLGSPLNSVPLLGFIMISTYHAWLGLCSIMTDYVQAPALRRIGLLAIGGLLGGATILSAISLFLLSLTH